MMTDTKQYKCQSCSKTYIYKYNYERHIACCKFFQKSIRQQEQELDSVELIPDTHSMFKLVQELAFRVKKLEKDNIQLKQQLSKRSKINIIDWLNNLPKEKQPLKPYSGWVQNNVLQNVNLHLNCVYTNDLIAGIISTLKLSINNYQDIVPIKAFENRSNIFYKYDSDENGNHCWTLLTPEELDIQLKTICKQFLVDFKYYWYDKNEVKIQDDEKWTDMYVKYYQKILGGSKITTDGICQKVRNQLYTCIKESCSQIIELDFS